MRKSNLQPELVVAPVACNTTDIAVVSLFESSLGIVKIPQWQPYILEKQLLPSESDNDDPSASPETFLVDRCRNRKQNVLDEELEDGYMQQLATNRCIWQAKETEEEVQAAGEEENRGVRPVEDNDNNEAARKFDFPVMHESVVSPAEIELEKSNRTVFVGNVPSNAIYSKHDYKTLKKFFSTAGKILSIRFRSIAFSTQVPRKVALVNHKLHKKQHTVNAYIVYNDTTSVMKALTLNGSVVLDRHIRVDSVSHPGKQVAKQCVFVGNLDFEVQEESLWRHFGHCGNVQYVRVVRDSQTNIGKGFAYIQFEDAMSVEQALLLNDRKVDGNRKLRVTTAKVFRQSARDLN